MEWGGIYRLLNFSSIVYYNIGVYKVKYTNNEPPLQHVRGDYRSPKVQREVWLQIFKEKTWPAHNTFFWLPGGGEMMDQNFFLPKVRCMGRGRGKILPNLNSQNYNFSLWNSICFKIFFVQFVFIYDAS